MSKRSRESIAKHLASLEVKRRRLDTQIAADQKAIKAMDIAAMLARLVLVSREAFVRLAQESQAAWTKIEYTTDDDQYHAIARCATASGPQSDRCWYRRDSDRVNSLKAMYQLKDMDDVWLCDKCYPNDERIAEAIETYFGGNEHEIDPEVYTDVDLDVFVVSQKKEGDV